MAKILDENLVIERLKTVLDPELKQDLVSLNMIKDVVVENGNVSVSVVLTTPACPLKNQIEKDVRNAISQLDGIKKININMKANVPHSKDNQEKEKQFRTLRILLQSRLEKVGLENQQ